jgi:flagellar biosynthesis/type III secretory pathway protein FliH
VSGRADAWIALYGQLEELRAKLRELAPEVEQAAMTIAEQMRREGEAQGRVQGRVEGRVRVLSRLLALKFGAIDAEHEALISAATDEDLDRYVERVLTAESLAAVFAK